MQRHEEQQKREEHLVGLLASVGVNPYRGKNKKPAVPSDFFPRLRVDDDAPEWLKLKRSFGFGG